MTTKFFDRLSTDLTRLLEDPIDYNVLIEVSEVPNNQNFKVHSYILQSRSPYFKNKFNETSFNDDHIKVLTMPNSNISIKIFNIIIKYIYGGIISLEKLENSIIFDLLIASNEFELDELEVKVWEYVIQWGKAKNPIFISGDDVLEKLYPYQQLFETKLWLDINTKLISPKKQISSKVLASRKILNKTLPHRSLDANLQKKDVDTDGKKDVYTDFLHPYLQKKYANTNDKKDVDTDNKISSYSFSDFLKKDVNTDDKIRSYSDFPKKEKIPDFLKKDADDDKISRFSREKKISWSHQKNDDRIFRHHQKKDVNADEESVKYIENNPYEFKLLVRGYRDGFDVKIIYNICDKVFNTIIVLKVKGTEEILEEYNPIE
ncbi:hypothetical protein Glove_350g83 [Diversispora epigaea]|uniref:BTB domain-containing protein n=1 Tax=Diversispora epigaea TaxID=1348612 RepID=A0A397HH32_9GLOM|nr:hypothetical protein Glove_350g83 [Diversispora epigaea]